MARTRPGIDRITRQALQAGHADAARHLKRHLSECITCKRAEGDVHMRCATWWDLAKTEHRTARKLRQYLQPETANMTPMITEAECDPPPF